MKKLLLSVVATVALSVSAMAANAADLNVGVIDMQQIMQKSTQVAAINNGLTKQFKPRQDSLVSAKNALDAEMADLNKNGAVMSAADRTKLQDKIMTDRTNLQKQMVAFQQDLNTAQNKAMQQFVGQLNTALGSVAKGSKLDLILQKQGVPYADPSLDVTNQVIQALNKENG